MEFFIMWIIGCAIVAIIGQQKTIGGASAFFLSFFLSPLVGIIFALASKDKADLDFQKKIINPLIKLLQITLLMN